MQVGFGLIYKGMLAYGQVVSIKKTHMEDENQVAQFINEVVILLQMNHRKHSEVIRLLT